MAHTGTVLMTVVVSLTFTAAVLGLAEQQDVATVPEPPAMVLEVNGGTYKGIQGDYCWAVSDNASKRCVEKIRADTLSVRTALVSRTVERNTSVSVAINGFERPAELRYRLLTNKGEEVRAGDAGDGIRLSVSPGLYLLVVDGRWERGNTTRFYQLRVVE